eukprot:m.133600 g.133600  ORF g.133600 m.133600 type:complete len:103 (-) comp13843_c0_seq1:556-864(-)
MSKREVLEETMEGQPEVAGMDLDGRGAATEVHAGQGTEGAAEEAGAFQPMDTDSHDEESEAQTAAPNPGGENAEVQKNEDRASSLKPGGENVEGDRYFILHV